jgi:hypothetical protein
MDVAQCRRRESKPMMYAYHIGNEIGKAEMRGRGSRAALGWRCRHLKPRELPVLAAVLEAARRWLHGGLEAAGVGHAVANLDEGLSLS